MPVLDEKLIRDYRVLHEEGDYGASSVGYVHVIQVVIDDLRPKRILDYGCGRGQLWHLFATPGVEIVRYDPAVPEISKKPEGTFDLVINTDVMEHIPEKDVDEVLADIRQYSPNVYFGINMGVAERFPDGTTQHCTIKPAAWWQERIARHFDPAILVYEEPGYHCIIATWVVENWDFFREVNIFRFITRNKRGFFPRQIRSIKKRLHRRRVKSYLKARAR